MRYLPHAVVDAVVVCSGELLVVDVALEEPDLGQYKLKLKLNSPIRGGGR